MLAARGGGVIANCQFKGIGVEAPVLAESIGVGSKVSGTVIEDVGITKFRSL